MRPGSPRRRSSSSRRRAKFITPIPKPKKRKARRARRDSCSMKARGFQPKSSNTTPLRSSMKCAATWTPGGPCPIPINGRSRRKRPGSFSTGGTTSSAASARSSARSRRWKPRSGSPRSRPSPRTASALLDHLAAANKDANPELMRLALKLATGAGKTTVMAMLIAWQTINAVRRPASKNFHARLSGLHTRLDDQRPAARPPTQRSRQLLRQPRTCSRRHARRREPGQDRHHQLPRLQAARAHRAFQRRTPAASRPQRRGTEHAGDRRPDAPARHARPDGHEEHPRHQ